MTMAVCASEEQPLQVHETTPLRVSETGSNQPQVIPPGCGEL